MRYSLFGILGFAVVFAVCSCTVSPPPQDDEESSATSDSEEDNSKSKNDKKKQSSHSDEESEEECEGESGEPWDGTTAKDFACGAGTKLSPYIIKTAEQLAHLSFVVNANEKEYQGKYYKLGADIKLNKGNVIDKKGALVGDSAKLHKWTPIGNSSVSFTGNFDGDGYTISGMFINTTSTHNGLFGNSSGTVQNLTIENSWVSGGKYTAGIVGLLKGSGVVKDVVNKATIVGKDDVISGIVAITGYEYSKRGKIENVENNAPIQGPKLVAGIIASTDNGLDIINATNRGYIESLSSAGGIGCHLGPSTNVEKVYNYGEIKGKEYTAGIASYFGDSYCPLSKNYGTIKESQNFGKVTGTNYAAGIVGQAQCVTIKVSANNASIIGEKYSGGISGYVQRLNIESVYNTGDIFGSVYVGGIAGDNEEGVTSSAYSTGKVDGDSLVGLMIGYNFNTTMADYYYLKRGEQEPFGLNNGGGVATPKTSKEMKSEDFAELLGEEFVYDSDLNDGYPVFNWEE